MFTTEQATKLVDDFVHIIDRWFASEHGVAVAGAPITLAQAKEQMVAALTGSSRIDRKPIDPNTETQLVAAVDDKPKTPYAELARSSAVLRQRLHEVLVEYVGCEPAQFKLRGRDLLFMVADVGKLMAVLGGPWKPILDQIEADEAEKKARTKFSVRSQEDEAKPILTAKIPAVETPDATPDAAKG